MRNTHISGKTVQAAPTGVPRAMLPDFTASMISSSLPRSVPPWKTTLRPPLERFVTSSARYLKPIAPDSGGAMMWARSSLRGPWAWVGAGPAEPARSRPPASAAMVAKRVNVLMGVSSGRAR